MEQRPKPSFVFKGAEFLALFLIGCYAFSFGASYHYYADTLRNFVFQYALGSLILALFFCFSKRWRWFTLMVCVFFVTGFEYFSNLSRPSLYASEASTTLKVAIYNRNYGIRVHDDFIAWLQEERPDVVVLQESQSTHQKAMEQLKDLYPYQISEPREHAFGLILASRFPVLNSKIVPTTTIAKPEYVIENFYLHADIKFREDIVVSLYTAHPAPPVTRFIHQQRNRDLSIISDAIKRDHSGNVIFMGDMNITPFSPYFAQFINRSGLRNEYTGALIIPTWPSDFINIICQIPIDHILHKGNLRLVSKYRGAALGSDHYPLVAVYAFDTSQM